MSIPRIIDRARALLTRTPPDFDDPRAERDHRHLERPEVVHPAHHVLAVLR